MIIVRYDPPAHDFFLIDNHDEDHSDDQHDDDDDDDDYFDDDSDDDDAYDDDAYDDEDDTKNPKNFLSILCE